MPPIRTRSHTIVRQNTAAPPPAFYDMNPPAENHADEILAGLALSPKRISPKFFYDHLGSRLFEQITELPEYYPTRTELALYERYGAEMAEDIGSGSWILELGSGNATKIRVLLDHLHPRGYLSADISKAFLRDSGEALAEAYPELEIHLLCLDYTRPWTLPEPLQGKRMTAFFPGSTIGNFEPEAAEDFLATVRGVIAPRGHLLIGVDLQKDPAVLHDAYNDSRGVTARFNLNSLEHVNRLADADFRLDDFRHVAFYNDDLGRIEMHLESRRDHRVTVAGQPIEIAAGERIHTESSYKYTVEGFQELAGKAGFAPVEVWTDEKRYFSVHLMRGKS